jgi:hypothetical protein
MAKIVKRTVVMWCNEEELNKWFENGEPGLIKLSKKQTKKQNIMVHVLVENPS